MQLHATKLKPILDLNRLADERQRHEQADNGGQNGVMRMLGFKFMPTGLLCRPDLDNFPAGGGDHDQIGIADLSDELATIKDNFTFECGFKCYTIPQSPLATVLFLVGSSQWNFGIATQRNFGQNSILYVNFDDGLRGAGLSSAEINKIYHMVAVKTGNDATVYLNGIKYQFNNLTSGEIADPEPPRLNFANYEPQNLPFEGEVYDMPRVYAKALNDREAKELYYQSKSYKIQRGLIHLI